ncbi:MAG TPA: thiamine phosphate synthase [Zeimonas sp.]|nr:thiamine phosphate synthase [Zeimonas sp.]
MKKRLPTGLYALTPDSVDDDWVVMAVSAAIRGGASAVQYRNKSVDAQQKLRQAQRIAQACRDGGALFIVNDSIELARAVGADGLHIGRDDGDPAQVRAVLGPGPVLGVSCYDSLERALAVRDVADYVAFGSVFVSTVKPGAVRAPLALFARAREAGMHAVAIGGIDAGNAFEVAEAGAAAVAVITAVFGEAGGVQRADATSIETDARRVNQAFGAGLRSGRYRGSASRAG